MEEHKSWKRLKLLWTTV